MDYLIEKEGSPVLDISEQDAAIKGIKDGDQVKVFNQRGEVILAARIRKKVRKGVACLPQGFWPSLVTGRRSANALTNDLLTDMGGGGAIQEVRVDILKV
jgi:anaerobic selenocysteine-containing dehydrogenase